MLQNLYTWMWGFGENNVTIQLCTKQQWPFPKTNILCMSMDVKINCLDVNLKTQLANIANFATRL